MWPKIKISSDIQEMQTRNSYLWDRVYQSIEGNRYPHEYLVKFINFIEQSRHCNSLTALDIGFGSYANLKMCHELGYKIYGIEASQESLRRTKERFQNLHMKFTGKLFTSPRIPFEDNKFTLIYSNQALYYNLNIETIIAEIRRTLVPGGAIYFTFFTSRHWYFRYAERVSKNIVKWSDDFPTKALRGLMLRYFSSKEELKNLFSEFKFLRVDDFDTNMLGIDFSLWIVTGFKDGENLKNFDMMRHYRNVV